MSLAIIELLKIVEKSIKEGYNVCIWPHLEYKDINEMILSGMTQTEIQGIIDSNTFSGLRANMEFINCEGSSMNVKLINYSHSPDGMNLLEQVAFAARVSNPANQHNSETAEKLVRYLIKHQHWSPLEMVSVCMEIQTTRDIARQILRHRSFSFQEFSQRLC